MDPTPIVDGIVTVIQSNPKTVGFLALIPFVQLAARGMLMIPAIKSTHPTYLNRALSWFARWPGPKS